MKREFLTNLGLESEQVDQIMAEHGKTVNSLKEDADSKKQELENLQNQLKERDGQLEELSKKAKGNEELEQQIADLQQQNENTKTEYEQQMQQLKYDHKLDKALAGAGAKNPKAVKALLEQDSIKLEGDDLKGFDEQLNSLKESDPYLFGEEGKGLKGRQPHPTDPNQDNNKMTKEQFNNLSYTDRVKLYQEQPDVYNQLKE